MLERKIKNTRNAAFLCFGGGALTALLFDQYLVKTKIDVIIVI